METCARIEGELCSEGGKRNGWSFTAAGFYRPVNRTGLSPGDDTLS